MVNQLTHLLGFNPILIEDRNKNIQIAISDDMGISDLMPNKVLKSNSKIYKKCQFNRINNKVVIDRVYYFKS